MVVVKYIIILLNFIEIISGNNKVISTSKIKKMIAMRKKCIEKGNRAVDFGSNPHSKGEFFSRSANDFFEVIFNTTIRARAIVIIIVDSMARIIIIYAICRSFNWKLKIIFILLKYLPHQ
jgi:hypothetical protein